METVANKATIESIRSTFLAIAQVTTRFHSSDLERVKNEDWTIDRFVLVNRDESKAFKALIKAMEWRKEFGVNELTEDHFPEEVFKLGLYHTNFTDKEGRPVLWFKSAHYYKSDLTPLIKQYLVYLIEKLDRVNSYQGWAIIVDPKGAGLSNIDMDFNMFVIEVLQEYYPRSIKYLASVDLPWILNETAKLIMTFMSEELKNVVKFIKKDELTQYLLPDSIPVHLGGTCGEQQVVIPSGVKPLEEFTHLKLSANQIKKIRSTFKDQLK